MSLDLKELPRIDAVLRVAGKPHFVVIPFDQFGAFIRKLGITGAIDAADYLKNNPDVAQAVGDKKIGSATEHYIKHGYFEGRRAKPALSITEPGSDRTARIASPSSPRG
jgi:hypothetical protein